MMKMPAGPLIVGYLGPRTDGDDKLFGGNVRYAKQLLFEHYRVLRDTVRRAALEP